MRFNQRQRLAILLFGVCVTLVLGLVDWGLAKSEAYIRALLDAGHFPLMAVVALLAALALGFDRRGRIRSFIFAIVFAYVLEVIQPWFGRAFEYQDFFHGALGALAALTGVGVWQARRGRVAHALFVIAVTLHLLIPVAHRYQRMQLRESQFPVLGDFEHRWELAGVWEAFGTIHGETTQVRQSVRHVCRGSYSLRLDTIPRLHAGVLFQATAQDWSPYTELRFAVFNPGPGRSVLRMRVDDDGDSRNFTDRYNDAFLLVPGWNHVSVSTGALEAGSGGRRLNMKRITRLLFFTGPHEAPATFYIDGVELRKGASGDNSLHPLGLDEQSTDGHSERGRTRGSC